MKNISFALTTPQFIARQKFVTRRIGWNNLSRGSILQAIEKGQGLKKGEKVVRLGKIFVTDVRREPLAAITAKDVILEGFPDMSRTEFIEFFCRANKCPDTEEVTRIEFGYLEESDLENDLLKPDRYILAADRVLLRTKIIVTKPLLINVV